MHGILSMLTAVLCHAQPLKNGISTATEYCFETTPFCHAYTNYTCHLKDLEKDKFNLLQNLHLYSQKSVCTTSTRPLGEVGGNSPLQLSMRTHFAKIEDKKVIAKNLTAGVFLVLVQPRKTRPCLTERLLMGRKESNQTNKQNK